MNNLIKSTVMQNTNAGLSLLRAQLDAINQANARAMTEDNCVATGREHITGAAFLWIDGNQWHFAGVVNGPELETYPGQAFILQRPLG